MKANPKVISVEVDSLIPYINNARTHSEEQVAQIAGSIKEFGWTSPILIDGDNGLIAGHGRIQAAKLLGLSEVPAIQLKDLTEAQKKALILADNKLALNAGWDNDLLKIELETLKEMDYGLELIGFSTEEINVIFNGWQSDIDVLDKNGENLDGIMSSLKFKVSQEEKDFAVETITNALNSAGIEYEQG